MRLTSVAGNPLEWVLDKLGVVPTPLMDTIVALMLARAIVTATKVGVFEALADGPRTADEVAATCGIEPRATAKLLFALAGARYVRESAGRYALTRRTRRWLLELSSRSLRDATLARELDARLMEHAETYVRTGVPTEYHAHLSPGDWDLYQRGQRSHALYTAPEVARRTPVPRHPATLLDVGGAHGHYAAALCRRHPTLRATILDLPGAVEASRPIVAREGLGDRIVQRTGDALTADLGMEAWDVVFVGNLLHHFDDAANRELLRRIARSLRPGGTCTILEVVRSDSPRGAGQVGALAGFFFAVTSAAGTWSLREMADWQRAAGLTPLRPVALCLSPGYALQSARKE